MTTLSIGCYRFDTSLNNLVLLDFKVKKYWHKNNDLIVISIVSKCIRRIKAVTGYSIFCLHLLSCIFFFIKLHVLILLWQFVILISLDEFYKFALYNLFQLKKVRDKIMN